ncbi:MAG TPA: SoxXA-binding protein [Thiolapillus brandeum]|uniref:SoxXA-binding protein n=1 Tax=Thiolapillus brandeum TaxID=1076588 RepID=A0A831NY73_9GAMM|nr:SoxXA-binding protein [Thiolapillus brandeum]
MKKLIAAFGLALLITGCTASTPEKPTSLQAQYESALKNAQAAVDKAASVGGEWRDIRWKKSKKKYLPSAIKAAEAGDYEKALKLLEIVQFQAEAGYKQAMAQKNAGPRF